jgi:hypothetical protein
MATTSYPLKKPRPPRELQDASLARLWRRLKTLRDETGDDETAMARLWLETGRLILLEASFEYWRCDLNQAARRTPELRIIQRLSTDYYDDGASGADNYLACVTDYRAMLQEESESA